VPVGENAGYGQRMGNVRFAALPVLPFMGGLGCQESMLDQGNVGGFQI
jgi:hypothetical protein